MNKKPIKVICPIVQNADAIIQATFLSFYSELPKEKYQFTLVMFKNYADYKKKGEKIKLFEKTAFQENITIFEVLGVSYRFNLLLIIPITLLLQIKDHYNLIYARDIWGGIIAYTIKKIFNLKFLYDARGLVAEESVLKKKTKRGSLMYRFMRGLEIFLVKNAELAVCVSTATKEYFNTNGAKDNILFVPNCINKKRFSGKFNGIEKINYGIKDELVVAFLGGCFSWHLTDEMIKIFKIIKKHSKNAKYLFITGAKKEWEEKLKKNGVNQDDFAIHAVDYDKVPRVLNFVDISILFIQEPFGNLSCAIKFAEYLASGVSPFILSNMKDFSTILKKHNIGYVIEDIRDNKKIEKEIIEFLDYYEKKKDNVREKCKKAAFQDLEYSKYVNALDDKLSKTFMPPDKLLEK